MLSPINSERLIGCVIALFGIVYSIHTLYQFDLGTFRRIGPGMFPLGLGITMTILGLAIAVLTPEADRETPDFALVPFLLVLLGVICFAVGIAYIGLFPAVILCVFVASLANRPFRIAAAGAVAAVLCVFSWLIFKVGLGLTLPLLKWPF